MKQKQALAILKSGRNVFLTGSAGAGKTYVLNQYIQYLRERQVKVAVTASTGIAATHMNGMTIHAWSGIGVKEALTSSDLTSMKTKKHLIKNLEGAKVLIIDEISMLHKRQINLVNQVLQYFKKNNAPFGGIQVIFSGDFFQLPPIGKQGETNRDKFAFMSKAWLDAKLAICYLTEQHRQKENDLNGILNEIRKGQLSENSIELLKQAKTTTIQELDPPKLFTHNFDVDRINESKLLGLNTKSQSYLAKMKGNKVLLESLKKSAGTPEKLRLKIGAKVMFSKNNFDEGYVNGTLGEVEGFSEEDKFPIVKTFEGHRLIVEPNIWSIDDDKGAPIASIQQIPLKLAWAITVHKSQGMTLDAAEMDLSKTFEKGQGYVGLSRLKNLEGLRLLGFNSIALEVDALALKADKRFQELSQIAEKENTEKELEQLSIGFLKRCGGLTSLEEIEAAKKRKTEKKSKKSTFLITREYIEKGLSIHEIAKERGLTTGTITGHIARVMEDYPSVDVSRFKPTDELLSRVEAARDHLIKEGNPDKIKEDGSVSHKAMYELMKHELDYQQIKLALAYLN